MSHDVTKTNPPAKHRPGARRLPRLANEYLAIAADAQPSRHYTCGLQQAKAISHGRDVNPEQFPRLGFPCYDVPPGSTVRLTIAFHSHGKAHHPKGHLRLRTDRGKLSAARLELNGTQDRVSVELTVPDETIKISVRAFLDGHARGKVHLHLEEPPSRR